ncbi:hypothetical protein MTsDn5_32980 [Alteromonas gracilis]
MDMKVDSQKLIQLRNAKAWSQGAFGSSQIEGSRVSTIANFTAGIA